MQTRVGEDRSPGRTVFVPLCALLIGLSLSARAVPVPSSAPLTLRFLPAGAVVVTAPTGQVLLYAPDEGVRRVDEFRGLYRLNRLDAVISGDADGVTLCNRVACSSGAPSGWQKASRLPVHFSTDFNFGDVRMLVITPPADVSARSGVALRIEYGSFCALLTGETSVAQTDGWLREFQGRPLGPVDVYGLVLRSGAGGETEGWWRSVRPRHVILRVDQTRRSLTPGAGASGLVGAVVWRTDLQGTVTVMVRDDGWYQVKADRGPVSGVLPPVGPVVPVVPPSLDQLPPGLAPILRFFRQFRAAGQVESKTR